MPNAHGQITREDFKAPAGKYRIIREEKSDGQLTIIGDIHSREFAVLGMEMARSTYPEDTITLCDENGVIKDSLERKPNKSDDYCDTCGGPCIGADA